MERPDFDLAGQVALVTEVAGQVAKLAAREGEAVQAGKVLVELDPAMQDAQIARAAAAVEAARANGAAQDLRTVG